jgi:hypothetical protein
MLYRVIPRCWFSKSYKKYKNTPYKQNADIYFTDLTFVCPCIFSIIVIGDQQDATILVYLFIPTQLYMFRTKFSPIIRSSWLYLQLLMRWNLHFHLIHDTSREQNRWTISEAVNIVKCSWWWAKTSPEICRAE